MHWHCVSILTQYWFFRDWGWTLYISFPFHDLLLMSALSILQEKKNKKKFYCFPFSSEADSISPLITVFTVMWIHPSRSAFHSFLSMYLSGEYWKYKEFPFYYSLKRYMAPTGSKKILKLRISYLKILFSAKYKCCLEETFW